MRRKDKEILDRNIIEQIIMHSDVCRLALSVDDRPYLVPLNFGYQDKYLYFHSAPRGKKINMIKQNSNVCFEMDCDIEIIKEKEACDWGTRYVSVIGYGRALLVYDYEEKIKALNIIMAKYGSSPADYSRSKVEKIVVIKVMISEITGKRSGY